jgi:uncharacterized membrane protein YqjE
MATSNEGLPGEGDARFMAEPGAEDQSPPSPWVALMALVADLRESVQGRIHLFSLELKQASAALGQMVALGLLAAFMAHAAWFALVIGLSWTAIALGAPWWAVMIAVFVLHIAIAGFAVLRLLKLAKTLGMPATMRRLTGSKSQEAKTVAPAAPVGSAAVGHSL